LAFLNPGDLSLIPSPAYPVYHAGTLFAGGESHFMPLTRENGFMPDLDAIPADVAEKAKVMFINYPNNPTAAIAELDFFDRVVEFARRHNVIVAHDAAYTELAFDDYRPLSFMQAEGAKDVGIEFHSLSKQYSMTGWRIGMVVGNPEVLDGLGAIKGNVDSGAFNAVQMAAVTALEDDQGCVAENVEVYRKRRDVLVEGLRSAGLDAFMPKATFYVWCPVPEGFTSADFTALLLKDAAIVTTPGSGFGEPGEGYVRFALTVSVERILQAIERIRELKL
jgi:LL-diaminopimelate aminotransferase